MTTDEDSSVGNSDFIGQDVSGKHLLLKVPSYEDSGPTSGTTCYQATKNTYVNLGRGMGDPDRNLPEWYSPTAQGAVTKWSETGLASTAFTAPDTSGDDLLMFFGGFADDKRLRGSGGTFNEPTATPPSESAARTSTGAPYSAAGATPSTTTTGRNAKVTSKIPDYLGWRDHTDGHRITTTRGDKIEIIGGNYKLLSLGRGQGIAKIDISGGITMGNDETPGCITSVTWRDCPTSPGSSGWKVVEQAVKANNVGRYHGTKRDEFYGDKLISVTGAPGEPTSGMVLTAVTSNGSPDVSLADTSGALEISTFGTGDEGLESYAYPTKWDNDGEGTAPPKLARPDIYESKWASSITQYTSVSGNFKQQSHYKGEHKERNIYEKGHKVETTMHGGGDYYTEVWHLLGSGGFLQRFEGAYSQYFFGASTTIGFANRFEMFVSAEEQVNLGLSMALSAGTSLEIKVGSSTEVRAGVDSEFKINTNKFWLAENSAGVTYGDAVVTSTKAGLTSVKTGLTDFKNYIVSKF